MMFGLTYVRNLRRVRSILSNNCYVNGINFRDFREILSISRELIPVKIIGKIAIQKFVFLFLI